MENQTFEQCQFSTHIEVPATDAMYLLNGKARYLHSKRMAADCSGTVEKISSAHRHPSFATFANFSIVPQLSPSEIIFTYGRRTNARSPANECASDVP